MYYECPKCGKAFARRRWEAEKGPNKCITCGYTLSTKLDADNYLYSVVQCDLTLLESPLDESPYGLDSAKRYTGIVILIFETFQKELSLIADRHINARNKTQLFADSDWVIETKLHLFCLVSYAHGEVSQKNFSLEDIQDPPPGCGGIDYYLRRMYFNTRKFVESYRLFLDKKDNAALEQADKNIEDMSDSQNRFLDEVDKVVIQLAKINNEDIPF